MHRHRHKRETEAQSASTTPMNETQSIVANRDMGHKCQPVSSEETRLRAYRRWENAGKPTGDGIQFWLEAEQELALGK